MRTCVIIPAYNESKTIAGLIKQVILLGFKVIVIDDGSNDSTADIAQTSGATVLRSIKNSGKGAALVKGYNFAVAQGFDAVISMDGDGQHEPKDLAVFVKRAESSNCGIVIGNRMTTISKMPVLRILTNHFMSWLISLITKQNIADTQCGFRLVRSDVLKKIILSTTKYETESEILIRAARLGINIESVPVETIYSGQRSQINPLVDTLRFLRFMFSEFMGGHKHV